jgi:hypothetical protein
MLQPQITVWFSVSHVKISILGLQSRGSLECAHSLDTNGLAK